eukprot:1158038-Pelagomonas_calceolata.AAC.4
MHTDARKNRAHAHLHAWPLFPQVRPHQLVVAWPCARPIPHTNPQVVFTHRAQLMLHTCAHTSSKHTRAPWALLKRVRPHQLVVAWPRARPVSHFPYPLWCGLRSPHTPACTRGQIIGKHHATLRARMSVRNETSCAGVQVGNTPACTRGQIIG